MQRFPTIADDTVSFAVAVNRADEVHVFAVSEGRTS
jgi:hypothetical protein